MYSFLITSLLAFSAPALAQEATAVPVRDEDFACIEGSKADQYTQDFNLDLASFGGRELCDSKIDTKKLFNDLQILEQGRFGADTGSNVLIRGFVPAQNYYQWVRSETRGMDRRNDIPYATAYNSGGYFTMQDGWAQSSTLGRVGTVVHEARHTEGYSHTTCVAGPYYGTRVPACDRNYDYGGSHAIEMEYYARVSMVGQNFHPVYKKMARLMAAARANFVFNVPVLQAQETLMILGQSGRAYLWNKDQWIERERPVAALENTNEKFTLKRTSFGAVLFSALKTWALDPYQNSGFDWNIADDYSYFKLLKDGRGFGSSPMQDFEEFDQNGYRYAVALSKDQKIASFQYGQGAWGTQSAAPAGSFKLSTTSPSGAPGFFMFGADRKIYALNPNRLSQPQLTSETWTSGDKNYVRTQAGAGFFVLRDSGEVYQSQNGQQTLISTPEPVSQMVSVPLYQAFEVQP